MDSNNVNSNDRYELSKLCKQYDVDESILEKCKIKSTEKLLHLRALFDYIDLDGSGAISSEEFLEIFDRINRNNKSKDFIYTEKDIKEFIKKVDGDGNGELDFDEFLMVIAGSMSLQFQKQKLIDAFKTFSVSDNNNIVNINELKMCIQVLYPVTKHGTHYNPNDKNNQYLHDKIHENEINELLSNIPCDADGYFNIKKFVNSIL